MGGMFGAVEGLVVTVLWGVLLAIKAFALIDCVRRPAAAFPAVGRQTKPLWLILTGLSALLGLLPGQTLDLLGLAGTVVSLIYLFDVRPRLQDITGGR